MKQIDSLFALANRQGDMMRYDTQVAACDTILLYEWRKHNVKFIFILYSLSFYRRP